MSDDRTVFDDLGYLGPTTLFTAAECRDIMGELSERPPPTPPDWSKAGAVTSRFLYELATRPVILDRLESLMGPDIMLWGAALVRRAPGRVHPWHTDVETSGDIGRTVSVWIGLENTTAQSSLHLVPHSHRFGCTIQELAQRNDRTRGEVSDEELAEWAVALDGRSGLVLPEMGDGDALWFDGRLWHGSRNLNSTGVRVALLLQYATPDTPIRIPDRDVVEWPFRFLEEPLPPGIMVRGRDGRGLNRLVPPPPPVDAGGPTAESWIHRFELPVQEDPDSGWGRQRAFRGLMSGGLELNCHASVLSVGAVPHAPHSHTDEELLVPLAGTLDVVLSEDDASLPESVHTIRPGSFVYYAASQRHTVRNTSEGPATYLMFKWRGTQRRTPGSLETSFFDFGFDQEAGRVDGRRTRQVFQAETDYLSRLHCHTTTLEPGAGYAPHVDAYDVGIVVLDGEVETLGQRIGPNGVAFIAAGEPHGMRNSGAGPARYLVFEFHAAGGRSGAPGEPRTRRRRHWILRLLRRTPIIWRLVPSGKRS